MTNYYLYQKSHCNNVYLSETVYYRPQFFKQGTSHWLIYRMHPKFRTYDFWGIKFGGSGGCFSAIG